MVDDTEAAIEAVIIARHAACPDPGLDGYVRVGWRSLYDGSFDPGCVWPGFGFSPVYVSAQANWQFLPTVESV